MGRDVGLAIKKTARDARCVSSGAGQTRWKASLRMVSGAPSGARILLVDNDADFCEVIAEILRDDGHSVTCAENGSSAFERLRGDPTPDVILLNLVMPVMNGWAFLSELRQDARWSGIPVVLLSGVGNVGAEADALGVAGYITKPIEVKNLKECIARLRG